MEGITQERDGHLEGVPLMAHNAGSDPPERANCAVGPNELGLLQAWQHLRRHIAKVPDRKVSISDLIERKERVACVVMSSCAPNVDEELGDEHALGQIGLVI